MMLPLCDLMKWVCALAREERTRYRVEPLCQPPIS